MAGRGESRLGRTRLEENPYLLFIENRFLEILLRYKEKESKTKLVCQQLKAEKIRLTLSKENRVLQEKLTLLESQEKLPSDATQVSPAAPSWCQYEYQLKNLLHDGVLSSPGNRGRHTDSESGTNEEECRDDKEEGPGLRYTRSGRKKQGLKGHKVVPNSSGLVQKKRPGRKKKTAEKKEEKLPHNEDNKSPHDYVIGNNLVDLDLLGALELITPPTTQLGSGQKSSSGSSTDVVNGDVVIITEVTTSTMPMEVPLTEESTDRTDSVFDPQTLPTEVTEDGSWQIGDDVVKEGNSQQMDDGEVVKERSSHVVDDGLVGDGSQQTGGSEAASKPSLGPSEQVKRKVGRNKKVAKPDVSAVVKRKGWPKGKPRKKKEPVDNVAPSVASEVTSQVDTQVMSEHDVASTEECQSTSVTSQDPQDDVIVTLSAQLANSPDHASIQEQGNTELEHLEEVLIANDSDSVTEQNKLTESEVPFGVAKTGVKRPPEVTTEKDKRLRQDESSTDDTQSFLSTTQRVQGSQLLNKTGTFNKKGRKFNKLKSGTSFLPEYSIYEEEHSQTTHSVLLHLREFKPPRLKDKTNP